MFAFVRDVENVDFPTAVRILAEKAGIHIEYDEGGESHKGPPKDKIFSLLAQVTEHYQDCLQQPAARLLRRRPRRSERRRAGQAASGSIGDASASRKAKAGR